jgi:hypothetical protein
MSGVADRASSFRARRIGMPERGADGNRKDGQQRGQKRRHVEPSKLLVTVTHYQRRTATHKMLTQTPETGKQSRRPVPSE